MVSRDSFPTASDDNAIVWVPLVAGGGDVAFQRFQAIDGAETGFVGCVTSSVYATCARVGNATFGFQLRGSLPNGLVFAVLSTLESPFVCSACPVVPDLATAVVLTAGNTSVLGDARVALPIPNQPGLQGLSITGQFVYLAGPCLGAFRTTDAVRATIQ